MKILIIEDQRSLSDSIRDYLHSQHYLCEQAYDYAQAKLMVGCYKYDCVLLDLMLPGGNGLDILQSVRAKNNDTGVIIISAKGALDDKLRRHGVRARQRQRAGPAFDENDIARRGSGNLPARILQLGTAMHILAQLAHSQ